MFFSLLLIASVALHWPFGIALMISLSLFLAILYFVIGGALAFVLVAVSVRYRSRGQLPIPAPYFPPPPSLFPPLPSRLPPPPL